MCPSCLVSGSLSLACDKLGSLVSLFGVLPVMTLASWFSLCVFRQAGSSYDIPKKLQEVFGSLRAADEIIDEGHIIGKVAIFFFLTITGDIFAQQSLLHRPYAWLFYRR